jgi:hypothetical protein
MKPITVLLCALVIASCTATGTGDADDGVPQAPAAPGADLDALHYTADMRIMESFPVQLDARMQVHNPLPRTVALELPGGCPLTLQVFSDSGRTRIAWDQQHAIVCTMQIQMVDLASGELREFAVRATALDVLGDSLPDGTYHFSARLAVNDTVITRPVGSVQLGVPR